MIYHAGSSQLLSLVGCFLEQQSLRLCRMSQVDHESSSKNPGSPLNDHQLLYRSIYAIELLLHIMKTKAFKIVSR